MDANNLKQFFVDIGIILENESIFEFKPFKYYAIKDVKRIKQI